MSTLSHPPTAAMRDEWHWSTLLRVREMWASLAIGAMWAAVAVAAVWAPDFVSNSGPGGSSTTIPSGIAVAMFATIGTWAVAKHAFGRRDPDNR
jgi:Mg/Co/Ni transporter MgtE